MTADLIIDTHGNASPKNWNIYLEGIDISKYCRNIKMEAGLDYGSARVTLELIGRVEFPEPIKSHLVINEVKNA